MTWYEHLIHASLMIATIIIVNVYLDKWERRNNKDED